MNRFRLPTAADEMANCLHCWVRRHYSQLDDEGLCSRCSKPKEDMREISAQQQIEARFYQWWTESSDLSAIRRLMPPTTNETSARHLCKIAFLEGAVAALEVEKQLCQTKS